MQVKIRQMQAKDAKEVAALWQNELANRTVTAEAIEHFWRETREDENYSVLVAVLSELGERPETTVGFITTVQCKAMDCRGGYLKINGLAVRESCQRQGIGTKLMRCAEEHARQKGLSHILLNSGFQRLGAHLFYEAGGYKKSSYCFTKKL